jgi:hypothetical protein
MWPLIFSFALTLSFMDAGAAMYEPHTTLLSSNVQRNLLFSQEMEARVSWGPVFSQGAIEVFDWPAGESFAPNRLGSTLGVGLDFDWLEVGYQHRCDHPVTPWRSFEVSPPKWEGWSDRIYVKVEGKAKLR